MKQIRKSRAVPRPFRALATACLVTCLGCAGGHARPTDYWREIYDTQTNHEMLISLSQERVVDVRGTKVSFVLPKASLEELDRRSGRYDETEERTESLYTRHIIIDDIPFSLENGKRSWSKLGIFYSIDRENHHYIVAFDKELDPSPTAEEYRGTRESFPDDFPRLLERLGEGKMHSVNLIVETSGVPTTAFAIPLDEDGHEIGRGPWGRLVAGMSFNPLSLELVARIVVVVPEGKSREESMEALVQKLDQISH